MAIYTDQTGNRISITAPPQRIVSLVPSQTELLYDLGLEAQVAGITKFCIRPRHWFRSKKRIGGPKSVDIAAIQAMQPDLILANKEENLRDEIDALAANFPVWVSDVGNLEQALQMIAMVGELTGTLVKARSINDLIRHRFANSSMQLQSSRAAYLIWQEPYMTVGNDTFIHAMMEHCGFVNIFGEQQRYPVITIDDICNSGCEYLLLSSEPFPFKQQHADALQALLPGVKIILVNGEMFSWYGSRLLQAPAYFEDLLKQQLLGKMVASGD
jgi:ABC-type Fe3+-hydroxamate transport system substrate-binding protein